MIRLQDWAAARRARGGAAIKVRVVKGANLPMEQVEASLHDWPLATWDTKQDSDTNYKRVSTTRCTRTGSGTSGSASPATTCSTSPSPGCSPGSAASGRHRVRDAARHGAGPGRGGQARRRRAAALHPGGAPGRVRRRDRLPDPPARGGRQPGQLHVRGVRAAATTRRCSSGRRTASWPPWTALDDAVPAPNRPRTAESHRRRAVPHDRSTTSRTPTRAARQPRPGAGRSWPGFRSVARSATTCRREHATISDARARSTTVIAGAVEAGAKPGARCPAASARPILRKRRRWSWRPRRADLLEVMAARPARPSTRATPRSSEAIDFAHYYADAGRGAGRGRRRDARAGPAHRGHPAVELPGRHPGRLDAGRARRRLRRRDQAGAKQARRSGAGDGRGAVGGRRPARRAAWSSSASASSASS